MSIIDVGSKTEGGDKPTTAYYLLVCTHDAFIENEPLPESEIYWGSKEAMEAKYFEMVEEDSGYTNIILTRMIKEAQLTYEHVEYGDEAE